MSSVSVYQVCGVILYQCIHSVVSYIDVSQVCNVVCNSLSGMWCHLYQCKHFYRRGSIETDLLLSVPRWVPGIGSGGQWSLGDHQGEQRVDGLGRYLVHS